MREIKINSKLTKESIKDLNFLSEEQKIKFENLLNEQLDMFKTSKQWYEEVPKEFKLIILDPDGWDRSNYEYSFNEELITKEEFKKRLNYSTIQCKNDFYLIKW